MMKEQDNYEWMVCVKCLTFNHAPYIVDAMNGFTMQETNFPFVCAIVDDASTDGEQEVIENYLSEHFDLEDKKIARHEETDDYVLTFARHKTNLNCYFAVYYLKYNHYKKKPKNSYYARLLEQSKYVAICEGDDYWINCDKLQLQTKFLENNADYGMVYGSVEIIDKSRKITGRIFGGPSESFEDLIVKSTIPTLTVMHRKEILDNYIRDIKPVGRGWLMGDYPKWLYLSHESKIKFLPIKMGCYRLLDESSSHSKFFEKSDKFVNSLFDMKVFFYEYYNVNSDLNDFKYKSLAMNALKFGNREKTLEYLCRIKKRSILVRLLMMASKSKCIFSAISHFKNR